MQLQEALSQISEIQTRIARTETFRGYRSLTVGLSGLVGIGTAMLQAAHVPHPLQQVSAYLILWISAAILNVAVVGAELLFRCCYAASPRTVRLTRLAVEHFLPCLAAGALLTFVLVRVSEENLWLLPGLWALVFSLGVFASCRLLPKPTFWVGIYYLLAGCACLALGPGELALSPWTMGVTFGGGQLLTAGFLYWTLERTRESQ
jgi:hypothetical protein